MCGPQMDQNFKALFRAYISGLLGSEGGRVSCSQHFTPRLSAKIAEHELGAKSPAHV